MNIEYEAVSQRNGILIYNLPVFMCMLFVFFLAQTIFSASDQWFGEVYNWVLTRQLWCDLTTQRYDFFNLALCLKYTTKKPAIAEIFRP